MKIFQKNIVYNLLEHWGDIKLGYIKSNRKKQKQIDAKYNTLKAVGMQTPALFTSPRIVADVGYTLIDVKTDKEIPDNDINSYDACIYEGHNRFWAWFHHLTTQNDGSVDEEFAYIFLYNEFLNSIDFKNAYHEINLNQEKTTTLDFARDLHATGGGNKILISYNTKVDRGVVSKAAGYATYNREFVKSDVVKLQQGKAPAYMTNDSILAYTDRVFTKVTEAFGCNGEIVKMHKALRGSFVWKFNAAKLIIVEADADKLEAETKKLEKLYASLPATSMYAIAEAKSSDGKTKEQIVHSILQNLYDKI